MNLPTLDYVYAPKINVGTIKQADPYLMRVRGKGNM